MAVGVGGLQRVLVYVEPWNTVFWNYTIDVEFGTITGACGQDTASPLLTPYPPFSICFFQKKKYSLLPIMVGDILYYKHRLWHRHLFLSKNISPYIHISRLMQSENGISIYISVDLCNQKTTYYC
jgi:hypothetical protein